MRAPRRYRLLAMDSPYAYLRGLDGVVPRRKETKASNSSEGEADTQAAGQGKRTTEIDTAANGERARGQGQFDYLRRLAHSIRAKDDELQQDGKGHIAAIGILGHDIYDKLLILQALRPEFPDTIFLPPTSTHSCFRKESSFRPEIFLSHQASASIFDLSVKEMVRHSAAHIRPRSFLPLSWLSRIGPATSHPRIQSGTRSRHG